MYIVYIIVLIILLIIPYTRLIVLHPFNAVKYAFIDFYKFFRYKKYNKPKAGSMVAYCGHFGKGKTLSAVYDITTSYNRYNDKRWYNGDKWVKNQVIVISNVVLTIPYIPLTNASQITSYMQSLKDIDDNIYRCIYIFIDEASVVLNSRSYKDNINPLLLNSLLTCRHYNTSFYYTSQKFKLVDALLRSVTQKVNLCNKIWRLSCYKTFDADEVENAQKISDLKPLSKKPFFCTNKVYAYYDTLATVDNLDKSFTADDLLSTEEILNRIAPPTIISSEVQKKGIFGKLFH